MIWKRLCENGAIPKRFHTEYLGLPFYSDVQNVSALAETDEEDVREECVNQCATNFIIFH